MKPEMCEQEEEVLLAVRKGEWNETLRQHLGGCSVCRETLRIAQFMFDLANEEEPAHSLPGAGFLWFKAEIRRKNLLRGEALRPLRIWTKSGYAATAVALAAGLVWKWPLIIHGLGTWNLLWSRSLEASRLSALAFPLFTFFLLGGVLILLATLTYAFVTEE